MNYFLPVFAGVIAIASVCFSPKAKNEATFFRGLTEAGQQPSLLTLTFSQVTTWIFARSLMNAAILGFYYGIWGTLAYAFYYLSFLTGGHIVDSLLISILCIIRLWQPWRDLLRQPSILDWWQDINYP